MDQYKQVWLGNLQESEGKLRSYKPYKHVFEPEDHLQLPLRIPTAKLRMNCHSLSIYTMQFPQAVLIMTFMNSKWFNPY